MLNAYSLRKNVQFQTVYRRGKSAAGPWLVLLYLRKPELKIGISVSKKVGNAVVRNRIKRRIREIVRDELGRLILGHYVIIARHGAKEASFLQLKKDFVRLLEKQRLYKNG